MSRSKTKSPEASRIEQLMRERAEKEAAHQQHIVESHASLLVEQAELEAIDLEIETLTRAGVSLGVNDMRQPLPRANGAGRPTVKRHPFPRSVGNVSEWARLNGVPYRTAKSWYTGVKPSPIPRHWQALLERTYGIPASAWRGGITDRGHARQ